MKITGYSVGRVYTPLEKPFKTALRTVDRVEDIVVRLSAENGMPGYGSAVPTAAVTGETAASITEALSRHFAGVVLGRDIRDIGAILDDLNKAMVGNTSAKAAVDIALFDLWGKVLGHPVVNLLGARAVTIETDLTISVDKPGVMAEDAAAAAGRGYRVLKIKVGKTPELDLERLIAVRSAVGEGVIIRIDANQGWKPRQALRLLNKMESLGLGVELVEQPTSAADIEGLKYVSQHSPIPVVADESVYGPADAVRLFAERVVPIINIKLMKSGGMARALQMCSVAEAFGCECMLGCMLEGAASAAAAVHLAAARPVVTRIDIDGPLLCSSSPFVGGPRFDGPSISIDDSPGFGITAVEGAQWI